MNTETDNVSAVNKKLNDAWVAINAYTKLVSQLATCKVYGHQLDSTELQELRKAKSSVELQLTKLMTPLD